MSNFLKRHRIALLLAPILLASVVGNAAPLNLGRTPTLAEVAGWDIDVRPDGLGLPPGQGSVTDGEYLYDDKCSSCHGIFGEGAKRWPKLAGGNGTLADDRPDKTVGSYWPYASTLWDYIHRAMPFPAPQSLETEEVYAITAYVLFLNDIVDEDFVLSQQNLAEIVMPNAGNFYRDDRPDAANPRCMAECKDPASIKIVASLTGITPTDHFKEDGNTGVAYEEEAVTVVEPSALSASAQAGQATYDQACKVCHTSGLAGAPKLGDGPDWQIRLANGIDGTGIDGTGMDTLYSHAIKGFQGTKGVMPAKGGQTQIADDLVRNAVDFMVESSR